MIAALRRALVVVGLCAGVWWAGGIDQAWYSVEYRVWPNEVHVDTKPSDCDFMHAPLGTKGCHYESTVTAYNAAGDVVGGDDAPKYGHDTQTGKPIVSWDNGKTWVWFIGTEIPDRRVKSVSVSWTKKTD